MRPSSLRQFVVSYFAALRIQQPTRPSFALCTNQLKRNVRLSPCPLACFQRTFVTFQPRFVSEKALAKIARMPKGHLVMDKIESEDFKSLFTEELVTLVDLFKKYNYEIRLAGGPVRDLLSGKKPADLDFATTATPDEMKAMFEQEGIRMINTKGEKHGTITARINDKENYEITTLRIDVTTDGRHAEVEFTKNWELDAGRRDLTINSLFLDFDGNVYDYFEGRNDLKNKRVRFVGNPVDRITEDYLRILRYFRFYGRIATDPNSHEDVTLIAMQNHAHGLDRISGERIWTEVKKILVGNFGGELMLKMIDLGIGAHIGLPDQPNLDEFEIIWNRKKAHNFEYNAISLLAALLKDETEVGKLHARLKLSSFERDMCLFIVLNRNKLVGLPDELFQCKEFTLMNTQMTYEIFRTFTTETLMYNGATEVLESYKNWDCPKFPLSGHILVERGIKGRLITIVMTELKKRWISSNFTLTADEMKAMLPELKEEFQSSVVPPTKKAKIKKQGSK